MAIPRIYFWDSYYVDVLGENRIVIKTTTRLGSNSYSPVTIFYDSNLHPPTGVTQLGNLPGFSHGAIVPALAGQDLGMIPFAFGSDSNFQMTSYITGNAPTKVDGSAWPQNAGFDWGWNAPQGAFPYNGFFWMIAEITNSASSQVAQSLRVYRSPDRITWTAMDTAHEPVPTTTTNVTGWSAFRWDGSSNLLKCAVHDPVTGGAYLIEFDMSTGLWGSSHDAFTAPSAMTFVVDRIDLASGDVMVFYFRTFGGGRSNDDIGCSTLHSGTWGNELNVSSNIASTPFLNYNQLLLDTNGSTVHVFFETNIAHIIPYYQPIISGALGSLHTFPSNTLMDADGASFGRGVIDSNGNLLMPFDNFTNSQGFVPCGCTAVWVGSPSATPTWSGPELIDGANLNQQASCPFIAWDVGGQAVSSVFRRRLNAADYIKRRNAP